MDKQQITRQLHRLAQEEIPDTMNLWPKIQGQLKRKSKPRSFSFAPALSVFVMLILVSVGGYAAYQTTIPEASISADDVTVINLVQTVEGVTAVLDWVYADAQIITLQYTLIYDSQKVQLPENFTSYLSTTDGLQIPQDYGGGGGGGGGDSIIRLTNQVSFNGSVIEGQPESLTLLFQLVYRESYIPPYLSEQMPTALPPDSMGFDFTVTPPPFEDANFAFPTGTPIPFGEFQPTVPPQTGDMNPTIIPPQTSEFQPTVPPPANLTIEPSLIPPMHFTPTPVPANPQIRFDFRFNVPFHPAKTGANATIEQVVNGLELELQKLRLTSFMTSFDLCYDLPDLQGEWFAKVSVESEYLPSSNFQFGMANISLDEQIRYPMERIETRPSGNPNRACSLMNGFVPFGEDMAELEIVVDYLYRQVDSTDAAWWAADEVYFGAQGFDLNYAFVPLADEAEAGAFYSQIHPNNILIYPLAEVGALVITMRDYPQQLTVEEAQRYLYDNMLRERVLGPWVFHVVVE